MTAPSDRVPGAADEALRDAVQDAIDAWVPLHVYLNGSESQRIAEYALAAAGRVLAERLESAIGPAPDRRAQGVLDAAKVIRRWCGLPPEGADGGGEGG